MVFLNDDIPLGESVVGVDWARLLRRQGVVELGVGGEQGVVRGAARDAVHGEAVHTLELPQGGVCLRAESAVRYHPAHGGIETPDEIQVVLQGAHIEAVVTQAQVGGKERGSLGQGNPLGIQLVEPRDGVEDGDGAVPGGRPHGTSQKKPNQEKMSISLGFSHANVLSPLHMYFL